MPSEKKVAWAQLRVGIMAAAALVLLFVIVFYITSAQSPFDKDVAVYTYMDSAPGIAKGVPVRLNGLLVGTVSSVEFSGDQRPGRFIRVKMEIVEENLKLIPNDSRVSVGSENLLSGRLLDIAKGRSQTGVTRDGELPADSTTEIEDLVRQGKTTLAAAELILKRMEAIVAQVELGRGSIGRLLKDEDLYNRVNSIAGEIDRMTKAVNSGKGTIGRLLYDEALYQDLRATLGRVDAIADSLQRGEGTAGKFLKDPALYNEAQRTVNELRVLVADLNAGKGTAGKLLKDETLHAQIDRTVASLNTLIDNLNQGKGTMGQLLVNQQLYENLNGVSVEMKGLLQDFRANPKKFLRIKLGLF
jgi:phospholipid/cholesterol/gamma-HCH transport system substrate-binding protein